MDVDLTPTPVRTAVTYVLQSPDLSGFENNQFQQMCLRLDFKRDHSRDSEALRSPLNLPNDKTPPPSESEAEFQPNLRGSTNTFETPTHLSPTLSLSPPCVCFIGRRTNDPGSPHQNCSFLSNFCPAYGRVLVWLFIS